MKQHWKFESALIFVVLGVAACSQGPTAFPWNLNGRSVPPYQILSTENPITDQYIRTFTVEAVIDRGATREDIKLASEKIIEGLPAHNLALIGFVSDPSEKSKEWTVAHTYWGPIKKGFRMDQLPEAGDYRQNLMKIAMKGQKLPGDEVTNY